MEKKRLKIINICFMIIEDSKKKFKKIRNVKQTNTYLICVGTTQEINF